MNITIDIDDPVPIFTQLIEQIKQAVGSNRILPGQALPSIRQLANDLEVNSKTVSKAYKLLERDEVIQTRGYRGTFVHPNAKDNCLVDLKSAAKQEFELVINKLREVGVTESEMRMAFSEVLTNK